MHAQGASRIFHISATSRFPAQQALQRPEDEGARGGHWGVGSRNKNVLIPSMRPCGSKLEVECTNLSPDPTQHGNVGRQLLASLLSTTTLLPSRRIAVLRRLCA